MVVDFVFRFKKFIFNNKMNIIDFIPTYPFTDDSTFNNQIFEKNEFYELRGSDKIDPMYLNHQKVIQRFLSPYTMYDELLLFAMMGTGKTLSAISVAEQALSIPSSSIKRILVIVKNKALIDAFMGQIIFATGEKYKRDLSDENIPPSQLAQRQWLDTVHQIENHYSLNTYETFLNSHKLLSNQQIKEQFSNRIVIMDEIHTIVGTSDQYNFYHKFLHSMTNRKILLMTGTPMRNNVYEFARIMNLILPLSQQFPDKSTFDRDYIDGEYIIPDKIPEIQRMIQGRVSYLKKFESSVSVEYEGEPIGDIEYFHIVKSVMSNFQNEVYTSVYGLENEGLRKRTEQASLFVFPNGKIGNDGLNSYIRKGKLTGNIQFNKDWYDAFSDCNTIDKKLARLRKFSCKYARIIENIIKFPRGKCFVFNESIMEGGSLVFGECLRLFGYTSVTTGVSTPGKRFALLSTSVMDEKHFGKVISSFNREENMNGENIQVLIGGIQISEGYTFKDVSQIHIATPHWNFAVIDQAIARAIRFRSHRDLDAIVRIFLHAALPISDIQSIDLWTYKTAEMKDVLIKRMELVIEESAMDCAINYDRNRVVGGKDNSRECLYGDCLFKCVNVPYPYVRDKSQLDYSTFNQYYSDFDMDDFKQRVMNIFLKKFIMGFSEFLSNFQDIDPVLLHAATIDLIENHTPLVNRYGLINYLHIDSERIFITNKIFNHIDFTESVYNMQPILFSSSRTDFSKALTKASYESIQETVQNMQEVGLDEQISMLRSLPVDIINMYIEKAVSIFKLNRSNANPLTEYIVKQGYNKFMYKTSPDTIYSTFMMADFNMLRKWTRQSGWQTTNATEEKYILDYLKLVKGNKYGFYLRYNVGKNQRNIVTLTGNIAKDYVQGGMNCSTIKADDLRKIALKTVGYEINGSKEVICKELFKWFDRTNLIFTF
jgi:hypothetical protein